MEENKYPQPMEALAVIIGVMAIIFLIFLIYPLYLIITGQPAMDLGSSKFFFILGALPNLVLPFLYARLKGYDISSLFRFRKVPANVLYISVIIGISLSVVGDELDRIIQIILPTPDFLLEFMDSMHAETAMDWVLLFIGVVLFASVSEELVFRGFLQVSLEQKGDVTRAVLLVSLAWTIIHANPYWAVPIFVMGVIIGFLAWRTGSIVPGIIVHGINNFLSLLNYNLQPEMEWYLMGDHVAPMIVIPALAVLVYSIIKLSDFYQQSISL